MGCIKTCSHTMDSKNDQASVIDRTTKKKNNQTVVCWNSDVNGSILKYQSLLKFLL